MNFILLLTQSGNFCGGIVGYWNPNNTGIWYYNQGIAKPPLPLVDSQGTLEAIASSYLLVWGPPNSGRLNATVWNLNMSTVKSQDKGELSTPGSTYQWEFYNLDSPHLVQHFPGGVDSAPLHQSKQPH